MRRRRAGAAAAVLAAAPLLAPPAAPPAQAAPNVIVAANTTYLPGGITIVEGTGVTFVNLDADLHDIAGEGDAFRAEDTGQGAVPVEDIETVPPGTYNYTCSFHEEMFGQITIEPRPV